MAHNHNPKHQTQLQNFLHSKQYQLAAQTDLSDSQKSNGGIWKIFQSLPIKEITVPASQGQTIAEIQIRFVDRMGKPTEGRTKTKIILQEFELKPGDRYDSELAESGLIGVNNLFAVRQASLALQPLSDNGTADSSLMVVTVEESNLFFFRFGGTFDPPTVLQGPARPAIVRPISNKASGFAPRFRLGVNNWSGNNQAITLGIEGGENNLGFDLDYRQFIRHDRGYAINIFNRRGVESEFDNGDNDIDLADGSDPWVHRLGGGVEYFHPWTENFIGALGMSYQLVSVRDAVISDELNSTDALGNTLTASNDGRDELLTLNYGLNFDRRNKVRNATSGFRTLFETDQSILIGTVTLSCSDRANISEAQNTPEKQNTEEQEQVTETETSSCPARSSRNWHAWLDRVAENEPRLNISGEVDLPTPGYKVEWQPGILDRRNPPAQRISISFIPPEGVTTQVITPTEVSFTMPSPILKYRSVAIYCGDKLLADIPDVTPSE